MKTNRPPRQHSEETFKVNVLSCADDPDLIEAELSARSVDISEDGLKLCMFFPLPESTEISLHPYDNESLLLKGEVRWFEQGDDIRAGVVLKEGQDQEDWLQRVKNSDDSPTDQ